ncbi:MAG TPA: lipoxygenase family protein, partial [Bryobacteraceae bacterium]|nr:lipoxygenase family protein [Bryobacteraceae bacterium]
LSYLVSYGDRNRPIPVIYHFKLLYACVFDVRSRGYLFASYMTGGYAQLWAKVACGHNVLFGESIQEIVREAGLIKIRSNDRWLEFDKLIVACSPNSIIDKMTPRADEAQVFSSLQDTPAVRGAFLARGLPKAMVVIADYFLSGSPGMGLIAWHGHVHDDVDLYSFVYAGDVATPDAEIKSSGEQSVARAFGGKITEWLTIKRLPIYQSYFSPGDVSNGIFERVEKLQGHLNTYYVGQAISIGTIPIVMQYAQDFVQREWGPGSTQSPRNEKAVIPAASPRAWEPSLLHSRLIALIVRKGMDDFVPTAAEDIPPPSDAADARLPCRSFPDVGAGIEVPITDEDGFARPAVLQTLVEAANRWMPFRDQRFEFPGEPEQYLDDAFAPHLPKPHFTWPDLTDPDNLSLFVLQGLGAHRVERTASGLALRMEFMSEYEVRPSLARYGGDALLGEDGRLQALVFGGEHFTPEHPDFAAQAFRFRSSVVSGVTLFDHLGTSHYGVANALLGATRRRLQPSHPLRIWLKPHTFRSGAANANATGSLLPDRGLVHRGMGFTNFAPARRRMLDGAFYEALPASLRRQGIHPQQLPEPLADRLPYSVDGMDFWNRIEAYVDDCLDASPALARILYGEAGEETRAWWDDLSRQLTKGLPPLDRESLGAVITWLLFIVTGFHAHVGHVAPYVRNANVNAGRPFAGAVMADPQNSLQMGVVAVITGLKVPHIDGDFSRSMPDAGALACYKRFQRALADLQEELDRRNGKRVQPFPGFLPRVVPCSVSR